MKKNRVGTVRWLSGERVLAAKTDRLSLIPGTAARHGGKEDTGIQENWLFVSRVMRQTEAE